MKTPHGLSPREREVLVLIAEGKSSRQIAEELGLSFKTVVVHRQNMHKKLGVRNAAMLTRMAIRMGLVKPKACAKRSIVRIAAAISP